MIVDFHTHIFPPWVRERRSEYLARDPCFQLLYTPPQAKMATAEELVSSMDGDGVEVAVALNMGWAHHELCVETNSYILEAIARYPKRLVGFCAIQPLAGEHAIHEMERCARAGARGIGELRPDMQGFSLADRELLGPVAEAAKKLGLSILFHASEPVGHEYKGKGRITPEQLYGFISAFPGLTVVCAHWGGGLPFYALMPEVAQALQDTYFDTAATPLLYRPQIFPLVAELIGVGKILFGSDYPLLAPGPLISQVRSLDLAAEATEAILGGNARRLLALK